MEIDVQFLKMLKAESYVSPKVKMESIQGKGAGLVAKEKISKGEIVSISGGVVVSRSQYEELKSKLKFDDYAYFIEEEFLIMPLNPMDPSADWRMNHCCEPNCGIQGQITFVALREIEPGEELTFDYCMSESESGYSFDLTCPKKSCRNKFSGDDWKDKRLQSKYTGFFSRYLQDKINHS